MKITIDIPQEFEKHFDNDRFKDSLERLKADAVHDIRKQELSQKEYALKYRIAQCTVSAIQHGRIWKEGDL